jgi:hypothetical protein
MGETVPFDIEVSPAPVCSGINVFGGDPPSSNPLDAFVEVIPQPPAPSQPHTSIGWIKASIIAMCAFERQKPLLFRKMLHRTTSDPAAWGREPDRGELRQPAGGCRLGTLLDYEAQVCLKTSFGRKIHPYPRRI